MLADTLPRKGTSRRGAPPGNKNAAGNAGKWYPRGNFLTRQLMTEFLANSGYSAPQRARLVRLLVKLLVERALAGDRAVIKEVFNLVEGRPRKMKRYSA
jgi:hypothetical protein